MDIYGFYYDENKKRYFRILDNANKYHPLLFSQKDGHFTNRLKASKKISSIPQAMSMQEINNFDGNAQECLLKARLKQMNLKLSQKLNLTDHRGNDMVKANCDYLLGDPEDDSLFGVWSGDYQNGSVIKRVNIKNIIEKEIPYNNSNEYWKTFINAFPSGNKVKDLTLINIKEAGFTVVMCLTNNILPGFATYSSVGVYYVSNNLHMQRQSENFAYNYEFRETLFSCSCHTLQTLAIGGQDFIRLFTPTSENALNSINDHTYIKLQGKAISLKFSPDGNRLYTGTNNGCFMIFDVRNKIEINRAFFNTKSITYLHPCKHSDQVIASCHDNQLFAIDVRNLKAPLLSFGGHVNDCQKIPVCVDESVNIISSMGRDYCVRFWSLYSGKLLHEIAPLSSDFSSPFKDDLSLSHSWFSHSWKFLKGVPKPILFVTYNDNLNCFY